MPSIEEQKQLKNGSQTYWRSLNELAETPEFRSFVEREFPEQASELTNATTRRQFLKFMGASLALAGFTSCRWPKEKIVPYANRPEGRVPGVPERYATAMELGGVAHGLLATSYDGRPVKIEGNPSHPFSLGAANLFAQAAVLELYDPDRSKGIVRRERDQHIAADWDTFLAFAQPHFKMLKEQSGEGLYILSEATSSFSIGEMRTRLREAFPQAKWYEYEPLNDDNEREGAISAFGQPVRTHLVIDQAKVILSLDSDFLVDHPAALKYARNFAHGRRAENGEMNRLYAVESLYTTTGAMADHRLTIPSVQIEFFSLALANTILDAQNISLPTEFASIKESLRQLPPHPFDSKIIQALANDLVHNQGRSIITAGRSQPASVHALVHCLNLILGNVGKTVFYTNNIVAERPTHSAAIWSLASEMEAGKVNTLLILGGNPVYDAPADLEFEKHLKNVSVSIHLSVFDNETSRACMWHVPRSHFLESWGDARAYDGAICTIQPLIEPLYDGKSALELLSVIIDDAPKTGYELVRQTFLKMASAETFESFWRKLLHNGILTDSRFAEIAPNLRVAEIHNGINQSAHRLKTIDHSNLEIVFCRDSRVYDGRFANNGWLQELPDFMTKMTWDNAALISPATAEALHIENEDIISLTYRGRELEIPAYIMPGQAAFSIAVALGYGRLHAGTIGNEVGANAYLLRTSDAMHFDAGLTLRRTGKKYPFACTQDHHAIDTVGMKAREHRLGELVREADLQEYREHPDFVNHRIHAPKPVNLWQEHEYTDHKWSMAIDLNACIGCNACVTACQAENNIPIVGREQVHNGREMHWIRLDRYFKGDKENPQVCHQPVACVHCENAPCEQVCPVAATVHSHEGLNLMVYNRCVGTRYCSNNCPYKVRRFNFFNYHKNLSETEKMGFNPEVTVRSRGVMEKCTYCIQRIEAVKIKAKNEKRPIKDGEIVTACQQTCPTRAIVFGDLNDPNSEVARFHANNRAYALLEELNVKPRTAYLAKIRNPNPEWKEGESANANEQHSHS
ncbi:MAG: 4Fe-4S dicluster domain-containing protein [Candidatus Omnitrophota bacterium]|jgi:molybdopterin-containing oxidoreductase family iron-sulfur binding subunit|nr:MAG: 4Fe-4S dicluster domain-containing protein [Candidatus Omnitrophota bacterium]